MTQVDGLLVVDKPAGPTSHDVVARVRRLAGTRRVGHAGTLDPMATGVLVLGIGRGTRLLGHLATSDKAYQATVRLGQVTVTDDGEGQLLASTPAGHLSEAEVCAAAAGLTGRIEQVPSAVSAIKVGGRRAYARVRAGEDVSLPAREVIVRRFDVTALHPHGELLDVEVRVECSSGTYVRALARDLGAALGVGGHLTALCRTRVGPYDLAAARTLVQLAEQLSITPLAEAAAAAFPRRDVDAEQARQLSHGGRLPATGRGSEPVAVFGPDGTFLALVQDRDDAARPLAVFTAGGSS